MKIGNRIYYNQNGAILFTASEIDDGSPRPLSEEVFWIDIDYGSIDYRKQKITSVDTESRMPIIEAISYETEEERRIRELEDLLLLQLENELGGIL